ncbi:SCP2 domain-containing protein [Candidatus Fukatsuia endosymbiont of Tuberolachnus salignus]|uniref:ubiquinone biosynthesis accessory factor UbiJ n=1 Tax=Candidatus Fukatsuia endosymbiont of Tuberolachnus salignus TaxID=3077957 RepID=UPI00313C09F0
MFLTPLVVAALETLLNKLLFRDHGIKTIPALLAAKVLRIELDELQTPLLLLFSDHHVDILTQWEDSVDCTIKTRITVLAKLRDRQQLPTLMLSGELIIEGDIQVAQQLMTLLDLEQWDPTEWLTPYFGDIATETLSQLLHKGHTFLTTRWRQQQRYCAETITEEWKIAPTRLEVAWFNEEVDASLRTLDSLNTRLARIEITK